MGLFDSQRNSEYRLSAEQAEWVLKAIGDGGLAGLILLAQMHPFDRLHLFDCRYLNLPKKYQTSIDEYRNGQRRELVEACKPYEEGRIWHAYAQFRIDAIRAQVDEYQALADEEMARRRERD